MATDVTRTSYDPARRYTGVVAQQGRVSLDAEANEQATITAEARQRELTEIIGPAGTPDDGYALTGGSGFDLTIGPGTMYVGGVRVQLDGPVQYAAQPDWLDADEDPLFTAALAGGLDHEHVVLELSEYAVSPAEDPVLREPALGGLDGAARLRTVQRVRRRATEATDCAAALSATIGEWAAEGLEFDPATMRLKSRGRLKVEFTGAAAAPNACEPAAAGGFLGADNQNIRVQVARRDPVTGEFDLLWGYDNASFLYRVTPDAGAPTTLTLDRSPVDTHHQPRPGQAVQVLRAAAELHGADPGVAEGWAAAQTGVNAVLTAPYDPDTRTVVLPDKLPQAYLDRDRTPQLYLRVWEGLITGITPGDPAVLPGTGLQARVTADGGGPVHLADHWSFAVRPATPGAVLPARLLDAPQPPDGPRLWACPLAVIRWVNRKFQLVRDCRHHFPPLTGITSGEGCCTVAVTPAQAEGDGLQRIIDRAAAMRPAEGRDSRITVCLRPGRYEMDRPLVLTRKHSRLHLEGCGGGVVLSADLGAHDRFGQGMITLVGVGDVRISGIEFRLPLVAPDEEGPEILRETYRSVGVRSAHCRGLEITRCTFVLPQGREEPLFGAGVLAGGTCRDLVVTDTVFERDVRTGPVASDGERPGPVEMAAPPPMRQAVAGVLLSSTEDGQHRPVPSRLGDALLRDNVFSGLSVAVMAMARRSGALRIEDNQVRGCYGGIWLAPEDVPEGLSGSGGDSAVVEALVKLARAYPLPPGFSPADDWPGTGPQASVVIGDNRIDCRPVPPEPGRSPQDHADRLSAWALLCWGQTPQPAVSYAGIQSTFLHGNQMSAWVDGSAVLMQSMRTVQLVVTGNTVVNLHMNDDGPLTSLTTDSPDSGAVVTGNLFRGTPRLPDRPLPPPLDTWLPLNTVLT